MGGWRRKRIQTAPEIRMRRGPVHSRINAVVAAMLDADYILTKPFPSSPSPRLATVSAVPEEDAKLDSHGAQRQNRGRRSRSRADCDQTEATIAASTSDDTTSKHYSYAQRCELIRTRVLVARCKRRTIIKHNIAQERTEGRKKLSCSVLR